MLGRHVSPPRGGNGVIGSGGFFIHSYLIDSELEIGMLLLAVVSFTRMSQGACLGRDDGLSVGGPLVQVGVFFILIPFEKCWFDDFEEDRSPCHHVYMKPVGVCSIRCHC